MSRVVSAILFVSVLAAQTSAADRNWQVYFSPDGGCTEAVVKALFGAKTSVYVQAYSFTSAPIAKALVETHRRGVRVQVILDKSQRTERYSSGRFLLNEGIPPLIDSQHTIAHNKVMLIDEHVVITGSFNFTTAAERKNAENLLVIDDSGLAKEYLANWGRAISRFVRDQVRGIGRAVGVSP